MYETLFRRFTKDDWIGLAGATRFDNGDEPLTADFYVTVMQPDTTNKTFAAQACISGEGNETDHPKGYLGLSIMLYSETDADPEEINPEMLQASGADAFNAYVRLEQAYREQLEQATKQHIFFGSVVSKDFNFTVDIGFLKGLNLKE